MRYRYEIDFLRAFAVFCVIIYHAEFEFIGKEIFEKGFLGVDIFFVISGYLITKILVHERIKYGRIDVLNFFLRRARRLFPVLTLVITFALFLGYFILLPSQGIAFAKSLISSLLFLSNFFFYFDGVQYGVSTALNKPLLHTWSLSVEEQFYLLFPILFILFWKTKRFFFYTLSLVFIASFATSKYLQSGAHDLAFYLSFARFWEILAGSLLALYEENNSETHSDVVRWHFLLPSILIMVFPMIFLSGSATNPGVMVELTILGTVATIYYSNGVTCNKNLSFSITPILFLGKISYSVYLWHFVLFSYARIYFGEPSQWIKGFIIFGTLAISAVSFYFIESVYRTSDLVKTKSFLIQSFLAFLTLIFLSIGTIHVKAREIASSNNIFAFQQQPWDELKGKNGEPCFGRVTNNCTFNPNGEISAVLIGDSVIAGLQSHLVKQIENSKISLKIFTNGGCPFLHKTELLLPSGLPDHRCTAQTQRERWRAIINEKVDVVILGGSIQQSYNLQLFKNPILSSSPKLYDRFFNFESLPLTEPPENLTDAEMSIWREQFKKEVRNTLTKLIETNKKIILIYPTPEPGLHLPNFLHSRRKTNPDWITQEINNLKYKVSDYEKDIREISAIYDGFEAENLIKIKPKNLFCDVEYCYTHSERELYYIDHVHLTDIKNTELAVLIMRNMF